MRGTAKMRVRPNSLPFLPANWVVKARLEGFEPPTQRLGNLFVQEQRTTRRDAERQNSAFIGYLALLMDRKGRGETRGCGTVVVGIGVSLFGPCCVVGADLWGLGVVLPKP